MSPLCGSAQGKEEPSLKKVVSSAIAKIGKHDQDCPPDGCFSGKGRDWCSEFVSWSHKEAGVPYSGGKKGEEWLLRDSGKIIAWYRMHGRFLTPDSKDWNRFRAHPGDYVFIGRALRNGTAGNRKHSGLVEFEDEAGTLHTIEGNNHRRPVSRYTYPRYRNNRTDNGPSNGIILGIGTLSAPDL